MRDARIKLLHTIIHYVGVYPVTGIIELPATKENISNKIVTLSIIDKLLLL